MASYYSNSPNGGKNWALIISVTFALTLNLLAQKSPAPSASAPSANSKSPAKVSEDSKERKKYKTLTDTEKQKLNKLLQEASNYLNGIRVQEAFEKIIEAEEIASDYSPLHNLKGAAYTKIRDFKKAELAFSKAVELDPSAVMTKFNLTEMLFVKGNFAHAEKEFSKFLSSNEDLPETTSALVNYKILICALKQGSETTVLRILKGFDFLDDHPAFYYSNAAINFDKGNKTKANSWLIAAGKIYSPSINNLYKDSLIEVGWLENLE